MSNRIMSFEQAVAAYFRASESTRNASLQPNDSLSELRNEIWYLCNINGPIAQVTVAGEVIFPDCVGTCNEALTNEQLERQDFVDNKIHRCLEELAGEPIEWDISLIGAVRDAISGEFDSRGIVNEDAFYPSCES